MMRYLGLLLAVGCAAPSLTEPVSTVCAPAEEARNPIGGPAFLHLHADTDASWITALFLERHPPVAGSNGGTTTIVPCLIGPSRLCSPQLPDNDELPFAVAPPAFGPDDVTSTFRGDAIEVAGLRVPYVDTGDFGYYHLDLPKGDSLPLGAFAVTWAGDWAYSGDLGATQAPMEITSPTAGSTVALDKSGMVALEWVPNITGSLTLRVGTAGSTTLYGLEDDTWFEVDMADVPGDPAGAELTLTHWQSFGLYHQGHLIHAVVTSDAGFTLE